MLLDRARVDQVVEALTDLFDLVGSRQAPNVRSSGGDAAAQQPVAGDLGVESEELFAQGEGMRVGQAEADVVAQRPDVGHVVVEALKLEQYGPQFSGSWRDINPTGLFERQAIGQAVPDGAVARYALG